MSSYHAWTHAPKEEGGTDPIPRLTTTLPTFRAILNEDAIDQPFFDESPPAGNSGMENPDTLLWNAWDNPDPTLFIEHLEVGGTWDGYLANIEYTAEGIYLVNWRIDFQDDFQGWMMSGTSYDREIHTKYHGCQPGANQWFYGQDGFCEVHYWNAADNFTDPSVEIIVGQDSGIEQIINGFGFWAGGVELTITYFGPCTATAVLQVP